MPIPELMKALIFSAIVGSGQGQASGGVVSELPWSPDPKKYEVPVVDQETKYALSLYPPDGAVQVDTTETLIRRLNDVRKGGTKWTMIEIYDYQCPHCWYAVPIYTQLAEAYQRNVKMEFTSLNCHMDYNMEACYLLEEIAQLKDYPSFVLCPPGDQGIDASTDLASLPGKALDLLRKLPTGSPNHEAFIQLGRCRQKFVEEAKTGLEDPFLSSQEIAKWVASVTKIQAMMPQELYRGADFKHMSAASATAPPGRPGWLRDMEVGRPGVSKFVPGERWYDALAGFVGLLHQGYRPFKHAKTLMVTRYLSTAFPVKGRELAELATRLEHVDNSVTPAEARNIIAAWSKEVGLGDPREDAKEDHRKETMTKSLTCPSGSSCHLWNLLHVTCTAVAARGFSGRTLLQDGTVQSSGQGDEVLLQRQTPEEGIQEAQSFVRAMVETFLSCRKCRDRFLTDYDNCRYGRCHFESWRSLPLWMWRVHNAINLHVAAQQNSPVDRRWPMYEECPSCWRSGLVLGDGRRVEERPAAVESRWSTSELDSPFDLKAIFWHLVQTFVGVRRIVFSVEDFHGEERDEVATVLAAEGIQIPKTTARGDHHTSPPHPSPPQNAGGGVPQVARAGPGQTQTAFHRQELLHRPLPSAERLQEAEAQVESREVRSTSQLFLGLLALSAAAGSIICYFGQDADEASLDPDMELADRDLGDLGRETRAPIFRNPSQEDESAELEEVREQETSLPLSSNEIAEAAE